MDVPSPPHAPASVVGNSLLTEHLPPAIPSPQHFQGKDVAIGGLGAVPFAAPRDGLDHPLRRRRSAGLSRVHGFLEGESPVGRRQRQERADADADRDFIGQIDQVRVYDRALSPSEVNALYRAGG